MTRSGGRATDAVAARRPAAPTGSGSQTAETAAGGSNATDSSPDGGTAGGRGGGGTPGSHSGHGHDRPPASAGAFSGGDGSQHRFARAFDGQPDAPQHASAVTTGADAAGRQSAGQAHTRHGSPPPTAVRAASRAHRVGRVSRMSALYTSGRPLYNTESGHSQPKITRRTSRVRT